MTSKYVFLMTRLSCYECSGLHRRRSLYLENSNGYISTMEYSVFGCRV